MAKAIYWQKGETLDYAPVSNHEAGDIVSLGTRVGVIGEDVKAGQAGHVHVVGVFRMPKVQGEIAMGDALFFSETDGTVGKTVEGGIPAGYAAEPAMADSTTVLVKLLG